MPIDRRITNGLAWAGAVIVIAIPAADMALRQFGPQATPQVAVVDADPEPERDAAPALPTPASQRPEAVPAPEPESALEPAAVEVEPETVVVEPEVVAAPDPVTTANATRPAGSNAVSSYLQSGRDLPSYISGGQDSAAVSQPATQPVAPQSTSRPTVTQPNAQLEGVTESLATVTRTDPVGFPTPVSERPAPLPRAPVATQPPLIVDTQDAPLIVQTQEPVVTAGDLEDWESGPLSEFLARRQGDQAQEPRDYDPDGFFLDEGPNSSGRAERFPRAYDFEYYPFE